jgi:hypothetical protein
VVRRADRARTACVAIVGVAGAFQTSGPAVGARARLCARAIVGLLTYCVLARYAALRISARARPEESPDGPSGSVATCRGSVATSRTPRAATSAAARVSTQSTSARGQPQPPRPVCEEGLRRTQCLLCRRRSVPTGT